METSTYYVPISAASLPHYLGKGIILPAHYYENKPADLQDQHKGYVMLSEIKWATATDCAIEVIMVSDEQVSIRRLNENSPFFLCNNGIPVSRIAAIHFRDRKQSEITQWNINSATAFLPDHLIKVDNEPLYIDRDAQLGVTSEPLLPVQDLTEKAKRYDILLGGLAFLKAAAKSPENFPKDYFAVLAYFNSKIKLEFLKAVDQEKASFDERLTSIFTGKKSEWSDIQPLIFDEVNVANVEAAARKFKVNLEKKYGLIELEKLSRFPNLYILALLATYGSNKPKNLQDLISGVLASTALNEERAEEIALVFGLHTRYSGLRNSYNGKELPIKFRLQSQLDYYTIESIYQYTFCGQKENSSFSYIDNLVGKLPVPAELKNTAAFWILDMPIITTKKKDREEELFRPLRDSYPAFHELLENIVRKATSAIVSEMTEKDRQINNLREELKARDGQAAGKVMAATLTKSQVAEAPDDDLEILDFKALKALAKSKKVPAKVYNELKPTFQGYSALIALIRSQKTLL